MRGKAYPIGGPYPTSRFISKTVATPDYGSVLATGDFNGDGVDEVAIGDSSSCQQSGRRRQLYLCVSAIGGGQAGPCRQSSARGIGRLQRRRRGRR